MELIVSRGVGKKPGNDSYRAVSVVTAVQGRPPNLFWGKRKGITENICSI